jgi:DME family drug/metabolite transporter
VSSFRPRLDRTAILAAALLFSTGGVAIKATSLDGITVAGARSAVAAAVLLLLMPRWRRFAQPRSLLVGVAYAATLVLFVIANKLTTAANAIFLQSTAPLYVLILAPWLLGERNRARDVALTAVLGVGMALFFVEAPTPLATAPDPLLGNAVATAAGLCWACTLVGLRWAAQSGAGGSADAAGHAVVAGNVLAALACIPIAGSITSAGPADLALIGYLGAFQIGLAYVLMTHGIARVPALETSLLLLLEPVMSSLGAWWIHGEQPGAWSLAGCAVVLATTFARILLARSDGDG